MQRDLRVAFDTGDRIDDDGAFLLHDISLRAVSNELWAMSNKQ
jgi:hypothetical protein